MNQNEFILQFGELAESSAEVGVAWRTDARLEFESGTIVGPYCDFAKTLTVDANLQSAANRVILASAIGTIPEPCYWSPELPFLYELHMSHRDERGESHRATRRFGLRRWSTRGTSFFLDSRRRVLRGVLVRKIVENDLPRARSLGATLLGPQPASSTLDAADRLGASLIVDLRGDMAPDDAVARLQVLSWRPSVLGVLVNGDQLVAQDVKRYSQHLPRLLAISASDGPSTHNAGHTGWANAYAVEWHASRPVAELAACGGPTIVIRRDAVHDTMDEARQACDRLQAELGADFDLAGYFVASGAPY